eukprot:COSAG06_NODE_29169_length_561_cov_1.201299_1_plen_109_part_00
MLGPAINGKPAEYVDVPISAVRGIDVDLVKGWKTFRQWMIAVDADPMLTIKSVSRTHRPRVPFARQWCSQLTRRVRGRVCSFVFVCMTDDQIELQSVDMFGPRVGFLK